jgi:hypothetical protein
VGLAPTGKAPPCHGARGKQALSQPIIDHRFVQELNPADTPAFRRVWCASSHLVHWENHPNGAENPSSVMLVVALPFTIILRFFQCIAVRHPGECSAGSGPRREAAVLAGGRRFGYSIRRAGAGKMSGGRFRRASSRAFETERSVAPRGRRDLNISMSRRRRRRDEKDHNKRCRLARLTQQIRSCTSTRVC